MSPLGGDRLVQTERAMAYSFTPRVSFAFFSVALLGAIACSGSTDDGDPNGNAGTGGDGTMGAGGSGSGGVSAGSGGSAAGTGGTTLGSGGSTLGTGGAGADTGGGNAGTGGDDAGTGGSDAGTGGGDAGTGGSDNGSTGMSPGCGATDHPTSGDFTITVNGKEREYTLDVPDDYDPNTPYPLTFGLHWRGGNSGNVVSNNYYGLKDRADGGMIFVSPEGLVAEGTSGWANSGGEDVELIALTLDRLEAELCIDTSRVFATGFSYGGMFSNAIACGLGDRFRAVAPYAGSLWSGCEEGSDPVAYIGTHGVQDSVVQIGPGREARDEFIERNGCSTTTTPYGSNGCVQYEGCMEGYPLVWCEYSGDHGWPDFSDEEVWEFFSQF